MKTALGTGANDPLGSETPNVAGNACIRNSTSLCQNTSQIVSAFCLNDTVAVRLCCKSGSDADD